MAIRVDTLALQAQEQGARAILITPYGDPAALVDTLIDLRRQVSVPAMTWLYALEDCPLPSVTLDEQTCMQTMAHHMLNLGRRDIAFAGTDPNTLSGRNRYQGLVSLLYDQNMAVEYGWFYAGRPERQRYESEVRHHAQGQTTSRRDGLCL